MIRRQIALELGLVVPPIRIRDNMQLGPSAYVIKIKGIEAGRGELMPGSLPGDGLRAPSRNGSPGIETREPAFGLPALWIPEEAGAKKRSWRAIPWSIRPRSSRRTLRR